MKKFLAVLVCAVLVIAAAVSVFAGVDDDAVKAASLELMAEVLATDVNNAIEMRGFTASVDGKYVYGGFLQGGRYTVRFNADDMTQEGSYKPTYTGDNELYCKGLACDDRGYLYVGVTHANHSDIGVAVVNDEMEEIGLFTEDLGKSATGINGVAVQKIGDKYLLYAAACYDADGIRCYDVTDPENISLYADFGTDGVMDYSILNADKDMSYVAVDSEGYVYVTYGVKSTGCSKGSHVAKISADGKEVVATAAVKEAYGICEAGDYVFVATKDGKNSSVYVLNKADLSEVTKLVEEDHGVTDFSDVAYGGGVLFVGDHGDNSTIGGRFLKAEIALTLPQPDDSGSDSESDVEPASDDSQETPDDSGDDPVVSDDESDVVSDDESDVVSDDESDVVSDEASSEEPVIEVPTDAEAKDVNGDNEIDNKDVVVLFRFVSGAGTTEIDLEHGDINGDNAIDNKDVVILFRIVSKG